MIVQRIGVPIYLQVKNHIMEKIKSGEFPPGMKIPAERELAQTLGISRNTVSAAYKELLLEGVLDAGQGRGTFVRRAHSGGADNYAGGRQAQALKMIDETIAKVVGMGFTVDQFIALAGIRAKEKAEEAKRLRVAVVDNSEEYIHHYITQISQLTRAGFEVVVLKELLDGIVPVELLQACDLVVTTPENQATVAGLMGGGNAKLVVVSTTPGLEAVIRLARLPAGTAAGIVAGTREFIEALQRLLDKTMPGNVRFDTLVNNGDQAVLQAFLRHHEVLVVSESQESLIRQMAMDGQEIIPFYYELDQGSLNQLAARLLG